MRVKICALQNFRCWDKLVLKDLTKYNVLIGENSTGKSSILAALLVSLTQETFTTEMVYPPYFVFVLCDSYHSKNSITIRSASSDF
ncbi:MAG: AAA family ATPase [Candidatus Hermodarchaeota archaeon]